MRQAYAVDANTETVQAMHLTSITITDLAGFEIGHFTEERRAALIASCKKHASEGDMQFIMGEAIEGDLRVVEG